MRLLLSIIACTAAAAAASQAFAQAAPARVVPTYEAAGIYWDGSGADAQTGCAVRFRKLADAAWTQGLAMWLDPTDGECRGSIVNLAPGTDYEVELSLAGQPAAQTLRFTTWPTRRPVAKTLLVPSGSGTLAVSEGGSPAGYVVYQGASGATLDAANASSFNVQINASHVIVRGLRLRGAAQDAIRISPDVTDVIIEDNDISGWGRERSPGLGVDLDSGIRAICSTPTLERVVIQRNRIHDPRYGANSWSDGHPAGPQAITLSFCGGNHVIRHNEIYSGAGHYFNDAIGGEDNFSTAGFPNYDSDIYGNKLSNAWDDGIEAEGGDRNVRVWGNYIDSTATGIATALASVGPVYLFRNVYNRSRELGSVPPDDDARQEMFKAGSDPSFADGRRYIFHNTMLQAVDPASTFTLGAGYAISGSGPTQPFNNTVSKNNIYHQWMDSWNLMRQAGTGNDFAYDMYNGVANVPITAGIHAAPTYAPGNGWQSESGGLYALMPGTPGYDAGVRIPNFNDDFTGAAPDVGADEYGTAPMRFGLAASSGPSVALRLANDFDANGESDLLWRNADGRSAIWLMNGISPAATREIMGAGTGWNVVNVADFNGDGNADLVWQHTDGRMAIYLMNGTAPSSTQQLLNAGSGWSVVQAPDLDGDGKSDLLFQNTDGSVAAWLMNGTAMASGSTLMGPGTGWSVIKVGDFDGDGKDDLLWKHTDGRHAIWLMNGLAIKQQTQILNAGNWTAVQVADLDGDGKADIVWQNADGSVAAWLMNGTAMASGAGILGAGSGWSVAQVGDFDGDGKADLLFHHTDGRAAIYLMNGLTPTATQQILNAGPWTAARILDLNGDGKSDIVWQNTDGTIAVWLMNGTTMTSGSTLLNAASGWSVSAAGH